MTEVTVQLHFIMVFFNVKLLNTDPNTLHARAEIDMVFLYVKLLNSDRNTLHARAEIHQ